ncbi:MAG: HAMP domain-containing histidine kinase [Candidatus Omnitrophica bacterium]|nr:HAMP domain-containing histidine kinase [Candidatus Omnitrophota bacterium]
MLQHNVVNILYAIKLRVELHLDKSREGCFCGDDEALADARYSLKKIYDFANRAIEITRKIGGLMRVCDDSGDAGSTAHVRECWRQAVRRLKVHHGLDPIEVIEHVPPDFPRVRCAAPDLQAAFYALAENALQAMKGGGKLILRASLQWGREDMPMAVLSVSDTGPGVPVKHLNALFDPFFSTRGEESGNGLGLCLVKGLVRRNEGSVSASSFVGCGSTFTMLFRTAEECLQTLESK